MAEPKPLRAGSQSPCPVCGKAYSVRELAVMRATGDIAFDCVRCQSPLKIGNKLHLSVGKRRRPPTGKVPLIGRDQLQQLVDKGHEVLAERDKPETRPGSGRVPRQADWVLEPRPIKLAENAAPPNAEAVFAGDKTRDVSPDDATKTDLELDRINKAIRQAIDNKLLIAGRFRLVKRLGEGSISIACQAKDEQTGEDVAVKFSPSTALEGEDGKMPRKRINRVLLIQSRFDSPHVPKPVGLFTEHNGLPYGHVFVESVVRGKTLRQQADEEGGALPESVALAIMLQLGQVLVQAEQNGRIVHRDIKPANVMIEWYTNPATGQREVRAVLIDFGLARSNDEDGRDARSLFDSEVEELDSDEDLTNTFTLAGTLLGTPSYMSPEQVSCQRHDGRTDIYGLGATIYDIVTSVPPLVSTTDSMGELLHMVEFKEPPDAFKVAKRQRRRVSKSFSAVLSKCLQKDPNDRFQTAEELMAALIECYRGVELRMVRRKGRNRLVRKSSLRPYLLAILLITLTGLAYGLFRLGMNHLNF